MYDARTKQLIWRGSAEDTLSNKAERNEQSLNKGAPWVTPKAERLPCGPSLEIEREKETAVVVPAHLGRLASEMVND